MIKNEIGNGVNSGLRGNYDMIKSPATQGFLFVRERTVHLILLVTFQEAYNPPRPLPARPLLTHGPLGL